MVPETLRKPWSAGLIATLSASLVLLQTSDDPQWIAAVWTGAVVFCVLVHGRLGAHLERVLAPQTPTVFSTAAPLAMGALWIVMIVMGSSFPPLCMLLFGVWVARWPSRRSAGNNPFDWRLGLGFLAIAVYFSVLGAWRVGIPVVASVWLAYAALFSGFARYIRPIQSRIAGRIAALLGIGALAGVLLVLVPPRPGIHYLLLSAMGMWFGRWFLADPAVDTRPDATPSGGLIARG